MHRGFLLVLFLLLAGCSRPIPPGTRLALLHPPDGALAGPDVTLLVQALAWGPGVLADLGDPIGGAQPVSSVPVRPLAIAVWVDGRRVRELEGGNGYRFTLHLSPGRHVLEITGGLRRVRTHIDVRDPPALRFVPAAIPPKPSQPATHGGRPLRLLRSGQRLLAIEQQQNRWRLWRLPLTAAALPATPLLDIPQTPTSDPDATFAACGEGFVAATYPTAEHRLLRIWHIPPTGPARLVAELPVDRLAADVVRHTGGFDAAIFLSGLQCFGAHVLFPLPGGQHVRIDPHGRWRITADGGPVLPLPDGRWLQLDIRTGVARFEGHRAGVALPLPPQTRTWRAEGPFPKGIFDLRPVWRVLPGWPPRLAVSDAPPGDEAVFDIVTVAPQGQAEPGRHSSPRRSRMAKPGRGTSRSRVSSITHLEGLAHLLGQGEAAKR